MNVGYYALKVRASVMQKREHMELAYEENPDASLFWCFIDLVNSSNFRIIQGPRDGYVRGETFFAIIRAVITPCLEIHLIKEIGDSVLLSSRDLRPLLEAMLLMDHSVSQLAAEAGTEIFPFAIRAGIGYGPAKRLIRNYEDFIGTPIDQLSRIMAVRKDSTNLLVHNAAYQSHEAIFDEYKTFLEV